MGERAPIGGGGVTFGAKRKAQRQPSFVSCYGDAISPSHWISPKASVLPGEVNPAKTTPDGVASPPQPQGGVGQRTGSQGPTNNLGTDHTALTSLATSPEQKKKKNKVLGSHLSSFSLSKNLITSNWCYWHTTGAHPASPPDPQPPARGGTGGWEPPGFSCPVLFAGNRSDFPMGAMQ